MNNEHEQAEPKKNIDEKIERDYDRSINMWNDVYSKCQIVDLKGKSLSVEPMFDICLDIFASKCKNILDFGCGTGDVISAVIAGSYLKEQNFLEAVKKSTDFASKCIQHSVDIDAHPHMGLCFEPLLKELGD